MENSNAIIEIERIIKDSQAVKMEAEGKTLVFGKFTEVIPPFYTAAELCFNDLSSFSEIIKIEVDKHKGKRFIQIINENQVECYTELDDKMRRHSPYVAQNKEPQFKFGQWLTHEDFIINLRSKFIATMERDELIKMISSISKTEDNSVQDDGITQKVTIKSGTMLAKSEVKSIVKLRPHRTFNEVEQPESEFLFRINTNSSFALFEADGGHWRIEARKIIATFLKDKFSEFKEIFVLS